MYVYGSLHGCCNKKLCISWGHCVCKFDPNDTHIKTIFFISPNLELSYGIVFGKFRHKGNGAYKVQRATREEYKHAKGVQKVQNS